MDDRKYYQKVVWTEGMLVTPHHLQQLDRYNEKQLQKSLDGLGGFGWGVRDVEVDAGELTRGRVALSRCAAITAAGVLIDTSDLDDPPPARALEGVFDPKGQSLSVFLAVPLARPGASTDGGAAAGGRPGRYQKLRETVSDENDGAGREIEIARKDLRILFEGEPRDGLDCLQVARLVRSATKGIVLDAAYVPPCVHLGASPYLGSVVNGILGALGSKSGELSEKLRSRKPGLADFTMGEAANFWLLHTVNASIPALSHFAHQPGIHPERAYMILARLAGELYTFSKQGNPAEIPLYDHRDLSGCFRALQERILFLLETIIPTRCFPVPLEKAKEARPDQLFTGRIPEELLEAAQFYLAVKTDIPDDRIIAEVPRKVRVSSREGVEALIARSLKGVPLKHLPTPPVDIPVQPGVSYFKVEKEGDHWEALRSARTLSASFPTEFPGLKVELMAVKE